MITVSIDFNVDDNYPSLLPFLNRLAPITGPDSTSPWCVDLSGCEYLGPDAAAVLFSLIVEARLGGRKWSVIPPSGPPPLLGFWRFSGLQSEVSGDRDPDPLHPSNETVRLHRFMRARWNLPDPVIRLIGRHFPLTIDAEDYLRTCMNEVFQNIEDHAVSPIGGVFCARFLSSLRQVRVAVVDRGRGIAETLKPRYPRLSSSRLALESVVKGGFSSKSRARNAGVGLRNLALFSTEQGGDLVIVTGNGALEMVGKGRPPRVETTPFECRGTGVFFTLNVALDQPD